MSMTYELWDTKSGNLLDDFESEDEALVAVRGYLRTNGPAMVRELVLGAVPSSGLIGTTGLPPVMDGEALLARLKRSGEAGRPAVYVGRGQNGGFVRSMVVDGSRAAKQAAAKVAGAAGKFVGESMRRKRRADDTTKLEPKPSPQKPRPKDTDPSRPKNSGSTAHRRHIG